MKKTMLVSRSLLTFLLLAITPVSNLFSASKSPDPSALKSSNIMSAKSLRTFDGRRVSLSEYVGKGKWLVVMIWAYDCPVCNKEAGQYEAFHKKHKDKDAEILGLTIDGWEQLDKSKAFVKRHHLTFNNVIVSKVYFELYHRVLTQRPFRGTPTILMFSPKGKLKVQQAGAVPTKLIEDYINKNKQASQ